LCDGGRVGEGGDAAGDRVGAEDALGLSAKETAPPSSTGFT
jgi:hypothetical protein